MKLINMLLIAALAVALSGCGGGGGGGSTIVDPPVDVTGPTFTVTPTAEYNESSYQVIFIVTVTDTSGIKSVSTLVNGQKTDIALVSGNTWSGTYDNFPSNYGDTDIVYTAVVTATDNKGNTTKANAIFTVPAILSPPPPPPDIQ